MGGGSSGSPRRFWLPLVFGLLGVLVWKSPTVHGAKEATVGDVAERIKGFLAAAAAGNKSAPPVDLEIRGREIETSYDQNVDSVCKLYHGDEEGLELLKVLSDTYKVPWVVMEHAIQECCPRSGGVVCNQEQFNEKGVSKLKKDLSEGGTLTSGSGFMKFRIGFTLIWSHWILF